MFLQLDDQKNLLFGGDESHPSLMKETLTHGKYGINSKRNLLKIQTNKLQIKIICKFFTQSTLFNSIEQGLLQYRNYRGAVVQWLAR